MTADGEKLKPLVKRAQRRVKVKRVLGDGSYNSHENFEFLASEGIEPGINVREDYDPNCGGQREEVVRAYLKDPPGWKERVSYGQRWMAESAVSAS
ncbi:MAG: transposase [Candidatus Bipolaricaulia bacterium]